MPLAENKQARGLSAPEQFMGIVKYSVLGILLVVLLVVCGFLAGAAVPRGSWPIPSWVSRATSAWLLQHFTILAPAPAVTAAAPAPVPPGPSPLDVPSTITVLLVCSYVIDRVVRGLLFLLAMRPQWSEKFPDPGSIRSPDPLLEPVAALAAKQRRSEAELAQKLAYFVPAFLLGLGIAVFGNVQVLHALGVSGNGSLMWMVDPLLTALVLMGGADQTSQLIQLFSGKGSKGAPPAPRPIEVYGKLVLEQPQEHKNVQQEEA